MSAFGGIGFCCCGDTSSSSSSSSSSGLIYGNPCTNFLDGITPRSFSVVIPTLTGGSCSACAILGREWYLAQLSQMNTHIGANLDGCTTDYSLNSCQFSMAVGSEAGWQWAGSFNCLGTIQYGQCGPAGLGMSLFCTKPSTSPDIYRMQLNISFVNRPSGTINAAQYRYEQSTPFEPSTYSLSLLFPSSTYPCSGFPSTLTVEASDTLFNAYP